MRHIDRIFLCYVHTFAHGHSGSSVLRDSASHAVRNVNVEQSNQDVGGDGKNDVQRCQRLKVVIGVTLQPIHWYGDDAVDYEQRGNKEMLSGCFNCQL